MIAPLTELEMEIVRNDNIILTKNRIIQIVYGLFGELAANYENTLGNHLIWEQKPLAAKISRGENYLGLPYVIMDYPRQFDKTDVFAIRSYFWWGNFFSITLQLSGSFQQKYSDALSEAINKNYFKGWYISLSDDPWQHHFKSDNYVLIEEGRDYKIKRLPFIKLAKKIPLEKWEEADTFFEEGFMQIIKALQYQAPIL